MIPEEIKKLCKLETWPPYKTGGQSVGAIHYGCKLSCEELGFEIVINAYRSQIKNKELAVLLFELYLLEAEKL